MTQINQPSHVAKVTTPRRGWNVYSPQSVQSLRRRSEGRNSRWQVFIP